MGASITRAMRGFVGWVARPYLLVAFTVLSAHLLPPVAAALLVLETLRRGPGVALVLGLISILALVAAGAIFETPLAVTLSMTMPVILGGVVAGTLLSSSRSLSFAFQWIVIGLAVGSMALFVLVPETRQIGTLLRDQILALLGNGVNEDLLDQFATVPVVEFVRVYLVTLLGSLLAALILGMWWFSLVADGVDFGDHFRALRLGRIAGIVLMVLVVAGPLLEADLIQYVAPLAVIGFLFQGLAVFHSRSRSDNWHPGITVALYIALFSLSPLTSLVLMGLSAVGLVDNFFELRARREPIE